MTRDSCAEFLDSIERNVRSFLEATTASIARLVDSLEASDSSPGSDYPDLAPFLQACAAIQDNGLDDELGIIVTRFARLSVWYYDSTDPKDASRLVEELSSLAKVLHASVAPSELTTTLATEETTIEQLTTILQTLDPTKHLLARFHIGKAVSLLQNGPQARFAGRASPSSAKVKQRRMACQQPGTGLATPEDA